MAVKAGNGEEMLGWGRNRLQRIGSSGVYRSVEQRHGYECRGGQTIAEKRNELAVLEGKVKDCKLRDTKGKQRQEPLVMFRLLWVSNRKMKAHFYFVS